MSTIELIASHQQQITEAEQLATALIAEWEKAARSGDNCEAIEDKQESTAKLIRRLELRIEQLHIEAANEAEAERISQAAELRDKIIAKYADMAKQYASIKAQSDKLMVLLVNFNQDAEQVVQGDIRQLKALGGESLGREVSQTFVGHAYDVRAFNDAWRIAQHNAASGLESGAYQVR